MEDQTIIRVDKNDVFLGYASRISCHSGNGLHHRAPVVLLENANKEVLLQKRKHVLFDNLWDITATTHVLHLPAGDETYETASERALKVELGITDLVLKRTNLGFNYFARDKKYVENEYCHILTGHLTSPVYPNKNVLYEVAWMKKDEFIKHCITSDPAFTPWAILTGKALA